MADAEFPAIASDVAFGADTPDPVAPRLRLDAERLRLVSRQVVRAPIGVLPASAFISYIMAPYFGAGLAWGWTAAVMLAWSGRAVIATVLLKRPPAAERVGFWIQYVVVSAALSGLMAGSAGLLFFSAPPLERALLTMVLCCWSAGGIAVSGAVPAAFYSLVTLFLSPVAFSWAVSGTHHGPLVAGLILFFMLYLMVFARDGAALVARALKLGFDNEELARRLRVREAEAHAARERAEAANLAKSSFLAAASHDLRQPLHSLSLLLEHLRHTTRDPAASEVLRQVMRSADSLDGLFTGLLDLSGLEAGSVTPLPRAFRLGSLLARLDNDYRLRAESKGLRFECAVSADWVHSDPEMLERVLRNLLDNAVKYTERGGVEVRAQREGEAVRVAVCDSGIGIDPLDRERIFEEYYQIRNPARDRSQGIGLGLAIVKRLCDLLGHAVEVRSERGRGSTFEVTVPRCEPAGADPGEGDSAKEIPIEQLRGLTLVVIDDDADVRDAMRTLLRGWGCHPVVCEDSEQALAELGKSGRTPDAIVADFRLAGGRTGVDAVEALFARYGDLPVAIITGEMNVAELRLPEHLPAAVMQKPVRATEIRDWLLMLKSIQ